MFIKSTLNEASMVACSPNLKKLRKQIVMSSRLA